MPLLAQGPRTHRDIVQHTRPVARATLILLAYRVEGTRVATRHLRHNHNPTPTPTPTPNPNQAPELLLATFDTSALLIDASGGGVASTATTRPSNHHPDPNPDPNTNPNPYLDQAASTYAALIGAHARVGDVSGARAVLDMAVQEAELEPTAPMVTDLI